MKFDIVIIGGGPTGINCAIEAHKAGLNYIILEKGVLVNSIFHFPANMTFFSTSKNLEIGDVPFISHQDKPTRREALEYYRRLLESYKLNIRFQWQVESIQGQDNAFELYNSNQDVIQAKKIIIATGFYDIPRLLNVPGEELSKVKHYYDEVHHYIRQKVIVVGGANSACDVALECWNKGADVTMVVRDKALYEKVKYWILPNVENRIKEGSIKAFFSAHIQEIREKEVDILTQDGLVTIANDYVLAMTGYRPNYDLLKKLGITFQEHNVPVYNETNYESNQAGIYLAGVIIGGDNTSQYFIENTRHHPKIIIEDIQNQ